VPSQLVQLQDGFASSDTWYALPDEGLPRLAIGRFPAQTPEQLQVMVAKTLAYEQNGRSDWIERSLFVSEAEPQFDQMNLELAGLLQASGYETSTLQMGEDEMMRYALMGTLAKGVGVINYAGDGYVSQWGNGQTFAGDDAGMLADNGHTPIFTTFTCNNGAFSEPQRDSLAEDLLWVENGGIVAAVAPSSRIALPSLTSLGQHFYNALLDEEVNTLGEALLQTQAAALNDDSLTEAVLVVNLLGDPALQLQRP